MAWDEWEQLKSEAAEKSSARMQLNQLPPEAGGGPPPPGDLKVNQKDLAAIGNVAYRMYGDLEKAGDHARASTQKAAGTLKTETFALGGALDHVASRWIDQVRSLLDACAHISNHLDYTKGAHAGDEAYIATVVSNIDTLDKGFDERSGS
ncbi:hypothetical protein ACH4NC_02900 [Streptomyces sp. NPDC017201]|uniref:hypothetical protein n=1 Tax=unclassified Streptomyces TaxID=2593676 RepID=UPI0029B78832|nr:hypothetical protein [Streptomyces sp. AK04-4c]MDX3687147.1 hypothetical protein [Streptomyces sp. AK04-4c]